LKHAAAGLLCVLTAIAAPRPATAQEADPEPGNGAIAVGTGPLETEIVVEKMVTDERAAGTKQRRFVAAQRLDAGDEVYYTIRVRNPGQEPVLDVVVTKRLPFGLDYIPGSAVGPACDVEVTRSHLRWTLRRPLAPGATALLRFRAKFR
jgi:uncharacterized repeat protein (TIGR01451 family)